MAKDKWIHLRVDEEEREVIKKLAGSAPVSAFISGLIEAELDRTNKEKDHGKTRTGK